MTPPTLTRSELDKLKATVDLVALFESHGVAVRKIGRSLKALCPFHEEKTPSPSIDAKRAFITASAAASPAITSRSCKATSSWALLK